MEQRRQPVTMSRPPRWAETLLGALTPRERRDSVLGDMLEEYRETKVPEVGPTRANRWYVKQVAAEAWRLSAIFCLVTFGVHAWRELVDSLMPVSDYYVRSVILSWSMMGAYTFAGAWAGLRTGRVVAGMISAALACEIGWSGAYVVAVILVVTGNLGTDPGGAEEMFTLPLLTLPLAVGLGAAGALLGTLGRRSMRRTAGA